MEDCHLSELTSVERTYTWTNGHVYSRIDKAIVNAPWMVTMPTLQVQIMDPLFSDHSPLSINLEYHDRYKEKTFQVLQLLSTTF